MSEPNRESEATPEPPEELPSEAGVPADAVAPLDTEPDEPAPPGGARPSVAPRSLGWRDEVVGTAAVTLIVGIWLALSPEALGYGPDHATWNPVVGGLLVAFFSGVRLASRFSERALGVILFVLGVWLAVSAFALNAPIGGQWNQASFGGVVALLSLVGLAGSERGRELNRNARA